MTVNEARRHPVPMLTFAEWIRVAIAQGIAAPAILRRFETSMLEVWADAAEHGVPTVAFDGRTTETIWVMTFRFWCLLHG